MRKTSTKRSAQHTLTTRVVCALSFCAFAFAWLYWFQADVLAVLQHELSGGVTQYNRTVGAIIITAVLQLVQVLLYAVTRLARRTHALTYLPSMLALAMLSVYPTSHYGAWAVAAPVVMVLWGGAVWLARHILPFENDAKQPTGVFSRRTWLNVLQLVAMMVAVALIGNTNAVLHYRAHAETALSEGHADEALRVGQRSQETDASLTMLRAYALSLHDRLADDLFCYPIAATGRDLLPLHGSDSHLLLMADTLLWDHLGRRPDSLASFTQYLDALERDSVVNGLKAADGDSIVPPPNTRYRHYRLMAMLIDRRLDDFVATLPRYQTLEADSLPRHYREALMLYEQQHDTLLCTDTLMARQWAEWADYAARYPAPAERQVRIEGDLRHSYWFYFFFGRKP